MRPFTRTQLIAATGLSLILITGCKKTVPNNAAPPKSAPQPTSVPATSTEDKRITSLFGAYKIVEYRLSDPKEPIEKWAKEQIGTEIVIGSGNFQTPSIACKHPKYQLTDYEKPGEEGNVWERTISLYWDSAWIEMS